MLANDLAQAIPHRGTTVIPVSRLRRELACLPFRLLGDRPDFFDRADADSIGFPQRAIDGSGFGHAHFGAVYERGNIRRIRVAVAHEILGFRFENGCFEDPKAFSGVGNAFRQFCLYS